MPGSKGRRTRYPLRELWYAIFYQAKNCGTWRALPHDFPSWPAVWQQYRRWRDNGTLDIVHEALRSEISQKEGRRARPSAAILDSQSVRVTEKWGPAGATTRGRRSPGASGTSSSYTLGLILAVVVTAANVQDRNGGRRVLEQTPAERYPELLDCLCRRGLPGPARGGCL
jgi:putative transposase